MSLTPPDSSAAEQLRGFFTEAGYTEAGLRERLDTLEPPNSQMRSTPRLLEVTRQPALFNTLVRWFFMGVAVDAATAREVVPPALEALLSGCGLLRREGDRLFPVAQVVPFEELWVASDFSRHIEDDNSFEHVLPISPSVRHLLRFMPRTPVDDTLDLGAGCGILALVAADYSREVIATDLNPRAEMFVNFNARLNGFDNIRCLIGDGFAPVAGRRFDLIISNPPFVLAPSRQFLYRDSGMELDQFCRRLAREAPGHLREGGLFQMICEWVRIGEQPWQERLQEWFKGNHCDAWVLMDYAQEPTRYAQTRLRESPFASLQDDAVLYDDWMRYYREHQVSWVQGGIVTLRRRSQGENWVMMEALPGDVTWSVHQEIEDGFRTRDLLAREDLQALLDSRLTLRTDAVLERISRPGEGEGRWRIERHILKSDRGLPHRIGMVADIADFLARFTGERTTARIIDELAAQVSTPARQVHDEALGVVRQMLLTGFLRVRG